jgi:cytochrome d ubiquinol oxidase subunit II
MSLQLLWFILVAVLYAVYFFLDGADFGVGILMPLSGKSEREKSMMIHAIGPHWGANEVWLLTAGGATFAAFPGWYATMFSGYYIALFFLLFALIFRGVGVEYRDKTDRASSKSLADLCILAGNILIPLLLGVALSSLVRGIPVDSRHVFTGTLWDLFSPITLVAGITAVVFFIFHGAVFAELKLKKAGIRFETQGKTAGILSIILYLCLLLLAIIEVHVTILPIMLLAVGALSLIGSVLFYLKHQCKASLLANALVISATIGALFTSLFPNVLVSSTDSAFNLTIYNSSSSNYTLGVMTIATCILLPIVIGYTVWSYWLFSKQSASDLAGKY